MSANPAIPTSKPMLAPGQCIILNKTAKVEMLANRAVRPMVNVLMCYCFMPVLAVYTHTMRTKKKVTDLIQLFRKNSENVFAYGF